MHEDCEDRFWAKVDKRGPNDCWEWTSAALPRGYGLLTLNGSNSYAHRLSWEINHGRPIPDGMLICHHCDNPACCNPAHLFLGTPADNTHDMVAKGRGRRGKHKLTDEEVLEIRARWRDPVTLRELGDRYGVSHETIRLVVSKGHKGGLKLMPEDVAEIKRDYGKYRNLMEKLVSEYGVCRDTISAAINRRGTYADI